MKCPACQQRAIDFSTWGRGRNWRRFDCQHCGVALKASRRTVLCFVVGLALLPLFIFLAEWVSDQLQIRNTGQRRLVFGAITIPAIFLLAFWEWRSGAGVLQEPPRDR